MPHAVVGVVVARAAIAGKPYTPALKTVSTRAKYVRATVPLAFGVATACAHCAVTGVGADVVVDVTAQVMTWLSWRDGL